jgi:hypothetical protein
MLKPEPWMINFGCLLIAQIFEWFLTIFEISTVFLDDKNDLLR